MKHLLLSELNPQPQTVWADETSTPNLLRASSRVPRSTLGRGSYPKGRCKFTKPAIRFLPFLLFDLKRFACGLECKGRFFTTMGMEVWGPFISSLRIWGSSRVSTWCCGGE